MLLALAIYQTQALYFSRVMARCVARKGGMRYMDGSMMDADTHIQPLSRILAKHP